MSILSIHEIINFIKFINFADPAIMMSLVQTDENSFADIITDLGDTDQHFSTFS